MYWSYPNFPSDSLICLTSLVGWFDCMRTGVSDVLYHFGFFSAVMVLMQRVVD